MFIATKELQEKAKYKKVLEDNETIGWTLCHKDAVGFNNKEKYKFSPAGESQVRPLRPFPAVCASAVITVP